MKSTLLPNQKGQSILYKKLINFLSGNGLYYFILTIFVLQALWVALSFRFPLAYDESYHFPLIQAFSHRLTPIVGHQPTSFDRFGDLAHSGSTLYHYLMSFPYRLAAHFTKVVPVQIVFLRMINIILFLAGIILFTRLFRKLKIPASYINVSLLFFVLLPIIPFLAAHINYDNLLFPLVAWFMLVCSNFFIGSKVDWKNYALVIFVGCVATLVKFAFAPIFLVAVIYIMAREWRRYGKGIFNQFTSSFSKTSKKMIALILIPTILAAAWFSQIYLGDILLYHNPQPSCARTLSANRCQGEIGSDRGTALSATRNQREAEPLPDYAIEWVKLMEDGNGGSAVGTTTGHPAYASPLPIVMLISVVLSLGGVLVLIYAWRSMEKQPIYYFFVTVMLAYVISIFYTNVSAYYRYHEFIAIQPRYLIQIVPIFIILMAIAINFIFRRHYYIKVILMFASFILFLNGAGVITHIMRSDPTWYWQKHKIIQANQVAQKILKPFIVTNSNL